MDELFVREIIVREPMQYSGYQIMGYYKYIEVVYTDNIEPFNYRKKKKFIHTTHEEIKKLYDYVLDMNAIKRLPSMVLKYKIGRVCPTRCY